MNRIITAVLAIIEILIDIVHEQGTRDCSGSDWRNEKMKELNKIQDELLR